MKIIETRNIDAYIKGFELIKSDEFKHSLFTCIIEEAEIPEEWSNNEALVRAFYDGVCEGLENLNFNQLKAIIKESITLAAQKT